MNNSYILKMCFGPGDCLPFKSFMSDELIKLTINTTSQGSQDKYKTRDGMFYIKECFVDYNKRYKDNFVEVIAAKYSALCKLHSDIRVVRQGLCKVDGRDGSYSEAFDRCGEQFIAFSRLFNNDNLSKLSNIVSSEDWAQYIIAEFSAIAKVDCSIYLHTMMLLDLIVCNEDRHLSNFGFVLDSKDELRVSPFFDFGLGLFEYGDKYYNGMPLDRAIRKIRLKPWDFSVKAALNYIEKFCPELLTKVLPQSVRCSDFNFPSSLAKQYFVWINERLGVHAESM